jgi:hypothetical protein
MHRKNWGNSAISISILVWMYERLSLLPVFSPLPVTAGEKKTYLFAIVPQFLLLEIKRDWARTPAFPSPIVFAASLYMQTLLCDIVHKHNEKILATNEAVNGTTFTVTIPATAIATGEAPAWS